MPTAARRSTRKTATGINLPRCDARTRSSRRYRVLLDELSAEVGGQLSAIDRELVAQAAGLALRAEQIRESIVAGVSVDADEAIRLTSECRRILLRLKSKAAKNKPAGPTLADYMAQKAAEKITHEKIAGTSNGDAA
jgi:hypothetical protein